MRGVGKKCDEMDGETALWDGKSDEVNQIFVRGKFKIRVFFYFFILGEVNVVIEIDDD